MLSVGLEETETIAAAHRLCQRARAWRSASLAMMAAAREREGSWILFARSLQGSIVVKLCPPMQERASAWLAQP